MRYGIWISARSAMELAVLAFCVLVLLGVGSKVLEALGLIDEPAVRAARYEEWRAAEWKRIGEAADRSTIEWRAAHPGRKY